MGRGGRGKGAGGRQRALRIEHRFSGSDDTNPNKYDDWEMVVPADGILNRVEVNFSCGDSDLNASAYIVALYHQKRQFAATQFPMVGYTGLNTFNTAVNMENMHILPIVLSNEGLQIDQQASAMREYIIRLRAGEVYRFKFSAHDAFDDQTLTNWTADVVVHFSIAGSLHRYQETIPYQIFVSANELADPVRWLLPAEGKFYSNQVIFYGASVDETFDFSIGLKDSDVDNQNQWVEVSAKVNRFQVQVDGDNHLNTHLFIPEFYVSNKGFHLECDPKGAGTVGILMTGFYAPNPGKDARFYISATNDQIETVPFPVFVKDLDVSVAWSGASPGDDVIQISHYPFDELGLTGTYDLFEHSMLLYSFIAGDSVGQDRSQEVINRSMGFGDVLDINVSASCSRYKILIKGKIPNHKYGMRPCAAYSKGAYVVQSGEFR